MGCRQQQEAEAHTTTQDMTSLIFYGSKTKDALFMLFKKKTVLIDAKLQLAD